MKICITIDDVLRNKTEQIGKIYKTFNNKDIDLESLDYSTNDYCGIFNFPDKKTFQKWLYEDYAFDIFASSNLCMKGLDKKLNLWLLNLRNVSDENEIEPIEVMLANTMEFNQSIPFTYFFVSKISSRIREVYLPSDSSTIWDKCDVIVTADPLLLGYTGDKRKGKKVIKIETTYNKDYESDYTYNSIEEFMDDTNIIKELTKGNEDEN